MKVKTDFVPTSCNYLTAGKVYEVTDIDKTLYSFYGDIEDDYGVNILIRTSGCDHLNNCAWTIVEE